MCMQFTAIIKINLSQVLYKLLPLYNEMLLRMQLYVSVVQKIPSS